MSTNSKLVSKGFNGCLRTKSPLGKSLKSDQRMETPVNVKTGPVDAVMIEFAQRRSFNSYKRKRINVRRAQIIIIIIIIIIIKEKRGRAYL